MIQLLSIIFLILTIVSCSDQTAGGTVEVPNGLRQATFTDSTGLALGDVQGVLIPESSRFDSSTFEYFQTDGEGIAFIEDSISGEYHLYMRNSIDQVAMLNLSLNSEVSLTQQVPAFRDLRRVEVNIQSFGRHAMKVRGTDIFLPTSVAQQGPFELMLPPQTLELIQEDSVFGERLVGGIVPNQEVQDLGRTLYLFASQASDTLEYESFYRHLYQMGFDVQWTLSKVSSSSRSLYIFLPGYLIDSTTLSQIEKDTIPVLATSSAQFESLGMRILLANSTVGVENANYWQLQTSHFELEDLSLFDAGVVYGETILSTDSIAWAQVGSPGVSYLNSLNNPLHSYVFKYPGGQNIQPGDYTFNASRVGFGVQNSQISAEASLLLQYLVYELLGGENY